MGVAVERSVVVVAGMIWLRRRHPTTAYIIMTAPFCLAQVCYPNFVYVWTPALAHCTSR